MNTIAQELKQLEEECEEMLNGNNIHLPKSWVISSREYNVLVKGKMIMPKTVERFQQLRDFYKSRLSNTKDKIDTAHLKGAIEGLDEGLRIITEIPLYGV